MKLRLLYICCGWLVKALAHDCDLERFESLSKSLKYDPASLNSCQQIIAQLEDCSDLNPKSRQRLLNQLSYRAGIIQLSLNQDLNAIASFERVNGTEDSFSHLSQKRVGTLYAEFGMWDKVDTENEIRQEFQAINKSVHSKWEANHDVAQIEPELQHLLRLSPYSLETRNFYLETLLVKLANSMDVSTAHEIIKTNEIVLDKYSSRISLEKRIQMHYTSAIIQTFILNTEPTHLRKCLALDMDFEPCRRLTLLHNRLKKVNPARPQILDPEVYVTGGRNGADWQRIVQFYLRDKKPCAKLPLGYKFENNYKLVLRVAQMSLEELFTTQGSTSRFVTDFHKFIDVMLCQAATESPSTKSMTQQFCKLSFEEIIPADTRKEIHRLSTTNQKGLEAILTNIWNSYPHLAIYVTQTILSESKNPPSAIQDELHKFFNENHLAKSANKLIQNQYNTISNMIRERQRKHQQQQQWNFQQQQKQQQYYRQPPPPNTPRTDRDYYKILGLPKTATSKDIRRAYLDFTKKYHPDKQGQLSEKEESKIHEKMSQINEAYETLSDDTRRKEYDQARSSGSRSGPMNPNMFRHANAREGQGSSHFGNNFKMNFGFGY